MEHDVAAEIANGRLVQVLDDWSPSYPGCCLYYPNPQVTTALRASRCATVALRLTQFRPLAAHLLLPNFGHFLWMAPALQG